MIAYRKPAKKAGEFCTPQQIQEEMGVVSIAYNNFTNNDIKRYEGFYASIGVEIIAEEVSSKGRIDLTLKAGGRTFLFE